MLKPSMYKRNIIDLSTKCPIRLNKEILRLAIPNIISNVSVPLISTVDTALMGHLSAAHLGAVGIGSMIFNFIYWNFGFLRMGTTGMTAQAYGANNSKEISGYLGKSMVLSIVLAAAMIILAQPIMDMSIYAMQVVPEQVSHIQDYFMIRIWAAPATFLLYALLGWYFGMQNAIVPLLLTLIINIANIVVSYYLVIHLNLGIAGVAWGTVIAQYVGLVFAIVFLLIKYRSYVQQIQLKAIVELKAFLQFLDINKDLFLRTVCLTIVFAYVYSYSSAQGTISLAANVILLQLLNWMSYGIDGFAYASESMVGKYKGARDGAKLETTIRLSFRWAGILALLYSITYFLLGNSFIAVFSTDQEVIDLTSSLLVWMIILPLVSFWCYIWDGVYIGLTSSKPMRNSMFISMIAFFGILWVVERWLPIVNQSSVVWLSLIVFLILRAALLYRHYSQHKHQLY